MYTPWGLGRKKLRVSNEIMGVPDVNLGLLDEKWGFPLESLGSPINEMVMEVSDKRGFQILLQ